TLDPMMSYLEEPVSESDLPFLALVGSHAQSAVENLLLYGELAEFAAGLEKKVEQRTAELMHANQELVISLERVQEAQEQLLESGKMGAVGTLVAGLSHELNNPLGVILGYAQNLMQRTPPDSPFYRPLTAIERQAQRCRDLIGALSDLSRPAPVA